MSDYERIKDSLRQFNALIETWDFDSLSDEEYEEVSALMDQTLLLLTGEEDEYEEDEDVDALD